MAGKRLKTGEINDLLKRAKERKSYAFDHSSRRTGAPLTDEAKDWAENNAQKRNREKQNERFNPIQRKKLERVSPITKHNQHNPSYFYSSENEARLNADSEKDYNVAVNSITARNKMNKYLRRKR